MRACAPLPCFVRETSTKYFASSKPLKRILLPVCPTCDPTFDSCRISNCTNMKDCCSAIPPPLLPGWRNPISRQFQAIRSAFATPEDINNNPNTAPSKRVLGLYPAYRKVLEGTLAAQAIGIDRMRQECPHFRVWLEQLEALGD